MTSRRSFLTGALGFSLATATQGSRQMAAQTPQPGRRRLIVDAQVHIWKPEGPDRPWVPGRVAQLPEPFSHERLLGLMNEAGVDRVVIVPPSWEGDRNDYAQEAIQKHPDRFAMMGRIALTQPQTAALLPKWKEQPGMLGIRLTFIGAQAPWLTGGTADWFWPAAEQAGLPVMCLAPGQAAALAPVAERHPRLALIIDHMNLSVDIAKAGKVKEAIDGTVSLARHPNVSVKLSSAPTYSQETYPFRDMTPHLKRCFEAFGRERCYWGTDMTNSFAKATYRQRITHFTEELDFLSEDDKDWIMGRAIVTRLGWA
jgi:predicted TIM-barrel fold metal-dependent hydrolase